MTAAEHDERDEYEAAVRQHLADVAAGDIQPATNGSVTLHRRRWGGDMMRWWRDRWPYLTYTAGIFVTLATLFIWVVPAAADAPSIAVHFISVREGYRASPYFDSAGCITVGYGELLTCTADARLADYSAVTEAEGEAFLRQRVEEIIRRVDAEVTVELHDEQMAALVSFVYNLGPVGVRQPPRSCR